MSFQTSLANLAERRRFAVERLDEALKLARFEAPAKNDADRLAKVEELVRQARMELT